MDVLNEVVLNQVAASPVRPTHVARVQAEGTCWLGATVWRGREALRLSFSNWSTTDDDVRRCVRAVLETR